MEKEIGWILQEKYPEINPADLNGASFGKRIIAVRKDIARFKKGEPLDHIIGFTDFLGCKILAGPETLIPRPETELMAEQGIEGMKVKSGKLKVLDMFAGSGCIGISIMRHVENAHVVFAESEKEAIEQIQKNCKLNKTLEGRYEIIQSDIFSNVKGSFDYILANPPYIPLTKKSTLQKSVIDYEPHAALFGGKDGMELIRRFLAAAKNRLNPSTGSGQAGKIYMEFDTPQKPAITNLLKKLNYQKWDFHRDQYGKWRWVVVQ